MSDPMDTIRDIVYPGRRAPVTPISDDVQAAGDDLRDADKVSVDALIAATFYEPPALIDDPAAKLLGLVPDDTDNADYGYNLPYPPRPGDLA